MYIYIYIHIYMHAYYCVFVRGGLVVQHRHRDAQLQHDGLDVVRHTHVCVYIYIYICASAPRDHRSSQSGLIYIYIYKLFTCYML